MSSSLRVNTIVPSTGTNVAIGTANGTVTFTDSVNFVLGTGSSIFSPASNTLTFGTNDAERLRIDSAGRIGINQTSPGAMLQVDYDEGSSEVGLRLRAYNASGSKTWQLSEINGNAGVFSIRNQTNSTEGLEIHADGHLRVPTGDLRVGDNTDSNAGTKTISVGSVSSGSGGIGIFANPTNGNSFVQFGDGTSSADQYRGYMNYRHADDSLRFGTANTDRIHITSGGNVGINTTTFAANGTNFKVSDGTISRLALDKTGANARKFEIGNFGTGLNVYDVTADEERLRIDSGGRIAQGGRTPTNHGSPNLLLWGADPTLHISATGSTANTSFAGIKFAVAGGSTGDYSKAGIFVQRQDSYNDLDMIFAFRSSNDATGVSVSDEKIRINSDGNLGIGENSPYYKLHLKTNSNATSLSGGTGGNWGSDGIRIENTNTTVGSMSLAHFRNYDADWHIGGKYISANNSDFIFSSESNERMRLYANGKLHLGNSHIASNNLTRLHVGWNTGGTVAGESIIAGTLGNDTSAVSALLTMKNAGNRGAQGASSGSSLAKFEFNNGTAFEIDKYGRRTLQYQPGCKVSIDTNSTGGGNNTQTGKTILPFNSTGFGYNIGNHFNTSNHTFTAPLAGRYLVLLSVNVIGDNIVYIYKNGTQDMGGEYRSNPAGPWEHCELCGVIECSANDTIQAYSYLLTSSGGRKFNGGSNPGSTWDTLSIYYLG